MTGHPWRSRSIPPCLTLRGLAGSCGADAVLTGIDLERGEVLALVGENGAGKSTPMRVVGGYDIPASPY